MNAQIIRYTGYHLYAISRFTSEFGQLTEFQNTDECAFFCPPVSTPEDTSAIRLTEYARFCDIVVPVSLEEIHA